MNLTDLIKKTYLYRVYHKRNVEKAQIELAIRNKYFLEEGTELLQNFARNLNNNNILFWLEFGSLLGYYREHDFIKHDCDIDFGIYLQDADKTRKVLENAGFKLIHQFIASDGGLEECYKYKHTSIDIFYFREDKDRLYCNSFMPRYPLLIQKLIRSHRYLVKRIDIPKQEFIKDEYKGAIINVPTDCVKHLKMHYGETFMTPNPNFNYRKEASNITYYDYSEIKGKFFSFGDKLS